MIESREKVSMSPPTGRRNLCPLSPRRTNRSPHTKENVPSSSHKEEESCKTSSRNSGVSSTRVPDSTSSKKSSCQGKCSPPAKEQPDSCDTRDHFSSSSRHKDRSSSDKSSRCGSDKESSNTPHKCTLSSPPRVEESSCVPSESSCTNYRSLSRSMSELEDHRSFTVPTSFSTPNKLRTQQCYQSSSTDSRLSMMPLDSGLYNNFSYSHPTGFCKGGATPATSVAGSHYVSSSIWQPPELLCQPCRL